ncbi:hypothetical protein ROHU_027439 [Labeo rohita]|uniref:Uncharacterized protein n=1 Tax=Labeo rohita TaxID=84645 RepID=A0A498M6S2_LABRO|nr:hypothetical protein ROHU_027439 [Labeo rohita]
MPQSVLTSVRKSVKLRARNTTRTNACDRTRAEQRRALPLYESVRNYSVNEAGNHISLAVFESEEENTDRRLLY